jgi:hypothetical protein
VDPGARSGEVRALPTEVNTRSYWRRAKMGRRLPWVRSDEDGRSDAVVYHRSVLGFTNGGKQIPTTGDSYRICHTIRTE